MKVLFITNHLEPERGGVSDYTRRLATECVRQGHETALISLNDKYVEGIQREAIEVEQYPIPMLRLSGKIGWRRRVLRSKEFVSAFSPDWISFQFVSYGFNPKGIVWNIGRQLKSIIGDRKLHIMVHELWIGESVEASLHDRLYRIPQRHFILKTIKELNPRLVNTQSQAYISILAKYGIRAEKLPLFGNIPVTSKSGDMWLFEKLKTQGVGINNEDRDDYWMFGMFGSLPLIWSPEPLFAYLKKAQKKYNKKIVILSIGDMSAGRKLWESICREYKESFIFVELEVQSAEVISRVFNSIDYGIATSPYQLVEKSGSVAAMLEHGLPVIVSRDDVHFRVFPITKFRVDPLIIKMGNDLTKRIPELKKNFSESRVQKTAQELLESFA
ncbi:MAG: hypothetical protein GF392_02585 [Candidatus Omnitrophica bacterium]|nr:hypothetical protein [Candidatus Omnitrophota bacterium]